MSKETTEVHKGGCHCGAVRYQATGAPVIVAHCHCEDCRRLSGTGHSTGAMFAVENFELTGQLSDYTLEADNGNHVTKSFCPTCGSPVLGCNNGSPGHVTVSLGTMDDASGFEPQVTIFARNRQPWDVMDDKLATFEDQPAWKPQAE